MKYLAANSQRDSFPNVQNRDCMITSETFFSRAARCKNPRIPPTALGRKEIRPAVSKFRIQTSCEHNLVEEWAAPGEDQGDGKICISCITQNIRLLLRRICILSTIFYGLYVNLRHYRSIKTYSRFVVNCKSEGIISNSEWV